jgi:hypothetical protein
MSATSRLRTSGSNPTPPPLNPARTISSILQSEIILGNSNANQRVTLPDDSVPLSDPVLSPGGVILSITLVLSA